MIKLKHRDVFILLGVVVGSIIASAFGPLPVDDTIYLPLIGKTYPCPTIDLYLVQWCPMSGCLDIFQAGYTIEQTEPSIGRPTGRVAFYDGAPLDIRYYDLDIPYAEHGGGVYFGNWDPDNFPLGKTLRLEITFANGCVAVSEILFMGTGYY